MFLSKLVLNIRDRQARCDLASPYELHRTLWRAFPPTNPGRIMFRVDPDRAGAHSIVLVQSDLRPEWHRLAQLRSHYFLTPPPEPKDLHLSLAPGQRLRFRLRANPTKKVGTTCKQDRLAGKKGNGQRIALLREEEQVAWLLHKATEGGFRIPGQWNDSADACKLPNFRVQAIPEGWVRCGKDGHTDGRFFAVRFEGILQVTHPAQLEQTVANGIGSAKGFGFGLLSLAPPEP
jgi:CRISPR system Cascade subunit CasE